MAVMGLYPLSASCHRRNVPLGDDTGLAIVHVRTRSPPELSTWT